MTKPRIVSTNKPLPFGELSPLEFRRMCLWLIERDGFRSCYDPPYAPPEGCDPVVGGLRVERVVRPKRP